MDRRWAPAAAAAAVVALVVTVTLVVAARDGDPPTDSALQPPAASEPATPDPAPSASAEPRSDAPTATPPAQIAPTPGSASTAATEPQAPDRSPAAPPATSAPAPAPAPRSLPPPASPAPGAGRAAFSFDAAYGTDEPREVIVQYGDSSSCPHEDVRSTVQESADRVVVTLEADAVPPERACTADYRQMLVPIRLSGPLGDRVLIDGSRGEPVTVDRSCQRVFSNPPPPKDCEP